MDERALQNIKRHLQSPETQERIRQNIQRGRSELTVTIGRAARLFNFTENQLRDWEEHGLLKPLRSKRLTGQRQYSPAELDKLAIIRELLDEGYAPGEIPQDIDRLWDTLARPDDLRHYRFSENGTGLLPLDRRMESADKTLFWRYFACQALRLSLSLLCEDMHGAMAGLLLPSQKPDTTTLKQHPEYLADIGESLIGWSRHHRSFYVFLETAPTFEYPSDFRIQPLQDDEERTPQEHTLIAIPRQAGPLNRSKPVVETIRRVLAPLYEEVQNWHTYFGPGMRDWLYPSIDFTGNSGPPDAILNGLAQMVVRLGGKTADAEDRWRFCCILLPDDPTLPAHQQNLVVQAQSMHAPHKIGITKLSSGERAISLRALQSGHILYRREVSTNDASSAYRLLEGTVRSAIAIPVGGEYSAPIAILYVVSDEVDAFSPGDQRVLRMIGKIVEELVLTYHIRQQVSRNPGELIKNPGVVDRAFGKFLAENDFTQDIETLLADIQKRLAESSRQVHPATGEKNYLADLTALFPGEAISIIAVDIDDQGRQARKYGECVMRNLRLSIGHRLQKWFVDCQLYHVHGGRFYALLKDLSLDQAREVAQKMCEILQRTYRIDAARSSVEQSMLSDAGLELSDISVHLGVTLYPYSKLAELLRRDYPSGISPITEVRGLIVSDLDQALDLGQEMGGNVVISWDPQITERDPHVRRFVPWVPEQKPI